MSDVKEPDIDTACRLQWHSVGNDHAVCRFCSLVVWVGSDATIEEHMAKCGPLATGDVS